MGKNSVEYRQLSDNWRGKTPQNAAGRINNKSDFSLYC